MNKISSKFLIALCLISLLLVGVGCSSNPTIDGSSETAMKASVQELMMSLPEEKRQNFKKTFGGMAMLVAMAKKGNQEEMRKFFDGMSYDDLMQKAQEFREKVRNNS